MSLYITTKPKVFLCFLWVGGGGVVSNFVPGLDFIRARFLTADPIAGHQDTTCQGVTADAEAVFFLSLVDASEPSAVLNKSPTASSRSGRSLAFADALQSPFPVRCFALSFCETCQTFNASPESFGCFPAKLSLHAVVVVSEVQSQLHLLHHFLLQLDDSWTSESLTRRTAFCSGFDFT